MHSTIQRWIRAVSAVAIVLATPVLLAQANLVGKDAPPFQVKSTIHEAPSLSLEECRGEVVLIKFWGNE